MIPTVRLTRSSKISGFVWVDVLYDGVWRVVRGLPIGKALGDG